MYTDYLRYYFLLGSYFLSAMLPLWFTLTIRFIYTVLNFEKQYDTSKHKDKYVDRIIKQFLKILFVFSKTPK